jgi:hypothetical protein
LGKVIGGDIGRGTGGVRGPEELVSRSKRKSKNM